MGRIGFKVSKESVETISRISKLPNIKMEGMFTHFAKADEFDKSYTFAQHEKFLWMKEQLEKNGVQISYYDCDNSAGIIDFPDMKHDLARAGISIYGMYPSDEVKKDAVDLKPALELISHISFVKDVEKELPSVTVELSSRQRRCGLLRFPSDTVTDIRVPFQIKDMFLSMENVQIL